MTDPLALCLVELWSPNGGFNVHVLNVLARFGVQTVRDVCQLTRRDVLRMRGMGEKSLKNIEEALAYHGLQLKTAAKQ